MPQSNQSILPLTGSVTLGRIVAAVRSSPRVLGVAEHANIRTVRAIVDGRQYNLGTVMEIGVSPTKARPKQLHLDQGTILLLEKWIPVKNFASISVFTDEMSTWSDLPPGEERNWQQEHLYSRRSYGIPENELAPYWFVDLHLSEDPQGFPHFQGPFYDSKSGFFASEIRVLCAQWLRVPGAQKWENYGRYLLLLSDSRAWFKSVVSETRSIEVMVSVSRRRNLVCYVSLVDYAGERTEIHERVRDGIVRIETKEPIQSFELWLFDT